jgi:hypothetical protein
MRTMVAGLALLLVLGALPPGAGQAAATPLIEDASGDLQATVAGNPVGAPAGRFAATDLRALAVEETATDLVFRLTVASLAASPELALVESTVYTIDFAHQDVIYRVMMYRVVADAVRYGGQFYVYDAAREDFSPVEPVSVAAEAASSTLTATVARSLVLDREGSAPFPGRVLTGFHAQSSSASFGDFTFDFGAGAQTMPPTGVRDAMPDSGNATATLPIRLGLAQTGFARLSSDLPIRASNGEATTFVFPVDANNHADTVQRFTLAPVGVPGGWRVSLPSDLVEIPAHGNVTLPVLVSMPFAHQHGSLQQFVLEMTALSDSSSVGRVQLGVRFVQPPQPAGHHDTMYLHSFAPSGDATFTMAFATLFGFDPNRMYFNTLSPTEDPNDSRLAVGASQWGMSFGVPPRQQYTWTVPLSPGLALGLDFDLTRQGSLKLAVDSTFPLPQAVLSGRLVHTIADDEGCGRGPNGDDGADCTLDDYLFGRGQHVTVARLEPSPAQDIGPATTGAQFDAVITATPEGDYLPFHPRATLVLQLNLTATTVDAFIGPDQAPKATGGELVLPLLEYHDPVDQVFSSLSSLMIHVDGEQSRLVNPGKTALFSLGLMNHGSTASYDLELSGDGSAWAQIVGDRRVTVESGKTRPLGIAVTAPADAVDGAVADLVLTAVDSSDPSARTLARLVVTVDTDAEHPDDSALVPGLAKQLTGKDAPGVGAGLLVLAFAALAVLRRRLP